MSSPPTKRVLVVAEPERLFLPNCLALLARRHPLVAVIEVPVPSVRVSLKRASAAFGTRGVTSLVAAEGLAVVADRVFRDRYFSLRKLSRRLEIPYHRVGDLHGAECRELISRYAPDVVFAQVGLKIRPELLELAPFWNKHCSLLPSYAGVLPVFWALLNGEQRLGVTVHRMDEGFDTGPILQQVALDTPERSFFAAYHRLYAEAAPLVDRALRGDVLSESPAGPPSYYGYPTARDGRAFRRAGNRVGRPFRLHPAIELVPWYGFQVAALPAASA
jgi:formyl transferase-like protein